MMACRFALTLATALALVGLRAGAEADAPAARIVRMSGAVEFSSPSQPKWSAAHAGLSLAAGSSLRTGDSGRAEVSLASGTVRVYENSLLRVPGSDHAAERVRLRKGRALFDIELPKGRQFHVETPEAVAAVKGTRFLVEAARGVISTGVFEGVVELRKLGRGAAPPVQVRKGFAAVLGEDAFELMVLDRPDPWRDWETGAAAPSLLVPSPTAASDGGEGQGDASRAVRAAVRDATDSALENAIVEDELERDAAPANQDAEADAVELLERDSAADRIWVEKAIERPERLERIDNSGPGSISNGSGSPSSGPGNPNDD